MKIPAFADAIRDIGVGNIRIRIEKNNENMIRETYQIILWNMWDDSARLPSIAGSQNEVIVIKMGINSV